MDESVNKVVAIEDRSPEYQEELDAMEYVYLDVDHNLWVAERGHKEGRHAKGFTADLALAKHFLRPEALTQLIASCKRNKRYRVPIRVFDLVASGLGLYE